MLRLLAASTESEIVGKPLSALLAPEYREIADKYVSRIQQQGGRADLLEVELALADDERAIVEIRGACVVYEGEIGVQIAMQDISERKRMENELLRLSRLDGLTQIANRRTFDEHLQKEWRRAQRSGAPISVVLADVDHFKKFNDTYGHLAGDDCLRKVAQVFETALRRPGDLPARYGGEEFVAVLPATDHEGAGHVAERIRKLLEELQIAHEASSVADHVTASLGAATMHPLENTGPKDLVAMADEALYEAKQAGRNRVTVHSE